MFDLSGVAFAKLPVIIYPMGKILEVLGKLLGGAASGVGIGTIVVAGTALIAYLHVSEGVTYEFTLLQLLGLGALVLVLSFIYKKGD